MKFDEKNLYDYNSCDKVKKGAKGYFGSALSVIKKAVETEDKRYFGTLEGIFDGIQLCRFIRNDGAFYYFYKVE